MIKIFNVIKDNVAYFVLEHKCPYRKKKITEFEYKCGWCKYYGHYTQVNCRFCSKQKKIRSKYNKGVK